MPNTHQLQERTNRSTLARSRVRSRSRTHCKQCQERTNRLERSISRVRVGAGALPPPPAMAMRFRASTAAIVRIRQQTQTQTQMQTQTQTQDAHADFQLLVQAQRRFSASPDTVARPSLASQRPSNRAARWSSHDRLRTNARAPEPLRWITRVKQSIRDVAGYQDCADCRIDQPA